MPLTPTLPAGFLELTTPGAFAIRALGLMIANCATWQSWCGVGRWQDACPFVHVINVDLQQSQDGLTHPFPAAFIDLSGQAWGRLDRTDGMVETITLPLLLIDECRHSAIDLAVLDYLEREGRLIDALLQLSGTTWTGETQTWPVLASANQTGQVIEDVIDGRSVLQSHWEVTLGGYA